MQFIRSCFAGKYFQGIFYNCQDSFIFNQLKPAIFRDGQQTKFIEQKKYFVKKCVVKKKLTRDKQNISFRVMKKILFLKTNKKLKNKHKNYSFLLTNEVSKKSVKKGFNQNNFFFLKNNFIEKKTNDK